MIHVNIIEQEGDVVDIEYFCSASCMEANGLDSNGQGWPDGNETDYDVYCAACSQLLWHGLESEMES